MAHVQQMIESKFTGSFFQAAQKVVPTLSTFGEGKGLAFAVQSMPISSQEIDILVRESCPPVQAGFLTGYGDVLFKRARAGKDYSNRRLSA